MAKKILYTNTYRFVERMYRHQQKCKCCKNTTEPPTLQHEWHIESKLAKISVNKEKFLEGRFCLLISTRSIISFVFILSLGHTIKVSFK